MSSQARPSQLSHSLSKSPTSLEDLHKDLLLKAQVVRNVFWSCLAGKTPNTSQKNFVSIPESQVRMWSLRKRVRMFLAGHSGMAFTPRVGLPEEKVSQRTSSIPPRNTPSTR
ncbi:hypothetical protein TNCV_1342661 [Trichonephila clavipes]|nr:hypothetical protein TNCV_1342661 [Trichonephila clavipes]